MKHTASEERDLHYKVLNSVTKLEVNKGHLSWTISQVAADSGVSRTLIYYYYGKEKEKLLSEAMRFMVQTVFNLEGIEPVEPKERIKIVLEQMKKMPYLLVLFYLNRRADNELGEVIRSGEEKLFQVFRSIYPNTKDEDFMMIYLLELGCALHGDVEHSMIDQLFSKLTSPTFQSVP